MELEKESLTNRIEDDLARRNRNWDKLMIAIGKLESLLKPTILWTGNVGEPGEIIDLSEPIDNFEKIVIWFSFSGQEFRDWYPDLSDYIDLKTINLINEGNSTYHQLCEMRLEKRTSTSLVIAHNVMLVWSNDTSSISPNGDGRVYGILGVGKKEL